MTSAEYAALPGITATAIKAGRKSMAHMRVAMLDDRTGEGTAAMRLGWLAHMALLEPVRFAAIVAVWNGGRRAGKAFEAWEIENAGKEQVTEGEMKTLIAMHTAGRADKDARFAISQASECERVAQWTAEGIGACKARFDGWGRGVLVEYKTCRDVTPRRFLSQAESLGYTLQLAWYWHGAGRSANVWLVSQETTAPYCCVTYSVPANVLQTAYDECVEICLRYRACEAANSFPGVCDTAQTWERPAWVTSDGGETDMSNGTMEASDL